MSVELNMQECRRRWQLRAEALDLLRMLAEGDDIGQIARQRGVLSARIYAVLASARRIKRQ